MHAGVGPPRAAHAYGFAREFLDCGFERALHGDADRLGLPADEGRTVVFNQQAIAGHRLIRARVRVRKKGTAYPARSVTSRRIRSDYRRGLSDAIARARERP